MKDTLGTRVRRIINGGLHFVADALESHAPEIVLEQTMREIDEALDEVRAELGREVAARHLANRRLMDENRRHETLSEQIETALAENREDLAEAAVSRQLDIEAQIPILEHTIADATERERELDGFVLALQARRREMEEELRRFREAKSVADSGGICQAGSGDAPLRRAERAHAAFNRMIERLSGVPMSSAASKEAAQLAELEELARTNRIRERLATVKNRLQA